MNILDELEYFIKMTTDAREMKRAIAVKMIISGIHYSKITELLGVSRQFISKWKNCAIFELCLTVIS